MKKSVISVLLALCLSLGLLPATAWAVEDAGLPKLATPTDLIWGQSRIGAVLGEEFARPGAMRWQVDGPCQNQFTYSIYRKTEGEPVLCFHCDTADFGAENRDYYYADEWVNGDHDDGSYPFTESGIYYFTVQSLGDGINYGDSETAHSEDWEFVKPDGALSTPASPTWDGRTATWLPSKGENESDTFAYTVHWYYSPTENGTPEGTSYYQGTISDGTTEQELSDESIEFCGTGSGYYFFRVMAISGDITAYNHSNWSELSGPCYVPKTATEITVDALKAITSTDAEEIRSAVQQVGTETLKTAMWADTNEDGGVNSLLAELETKTGITTTVEVDEQIKEIFDPGQVSIIGAALNPLKENATEIKLNVAPLKEETELIIPELYNATLATRFSMDLDGVNDPAELSVPVKIALPIPSNINPDYLVILHYHTDGEPQVIQPEILEKDGTRFASFVLTQFSDFVITESKNGDDPPIAPTPLTISAAKVANKTYNGKTDGKVTSVTFDGLPGGESLTIEKDYTATAVFADAEIGNDKAVTVTVTLRNKNYTLAENTFQTTANIKKRSSGYIPTGGSGGTSEEKPPVETPPVQTTPPVETPPAQTPPAEEPSPMPPFTDVAPSAWYYDAVAYVYQKGLMNGTKKDVQFSPEVTMTRAMVMTVLARMDGVDTAGGAAWYAKAQSWAVQKGVSSGERPEEEITREQLVTMLWRYAGQPEAAGDLAGFIDGGSVSGYARTAVQWAVEAGLVNGYKDGSFRPRGSASRAEVAAILMRYCEMLEK